MLRKFLPFVLAGLTALFVVAALMPKPQATVVVAAYNLPAGHTLIADDLTERALPQDAIPTNAITNTVSLIGKTLNVPRTVGDVMTTEHLGAPVTLAPDERALAIHVTDSTGLAGLLRPGQRVGVAAILLDRTGQGAYSKVTLNALRVLYLPPTFRAPTETDPERDGANPMGSQSVTQSRRDQGVVVLAVPITLQQIVYEPPMLDTHSPESLFSQVRWLNPVELLTALNASPDTVLSLFLEPENPAAFTTTGLNLNALFTTPDFTVEPAPASEGAGQ